MFNFLSGMMKGGAGGMARGLGGGARAAAGGQQGLGMMDRFRQNVQNPQFQQTLGGMGAQMAGLDPSLGSGMVQGVQNRRLQTGFDQAIKPIQRQTMPMPGLEKPALDMAALMPQRKPMAIPQQAQAPMGAEGLGGGAWADPRLRELLYGQRFSRY